MCGRNIQKIYVALSSAKSDNFYLRPLSKANGNVWYANVPIERHKLNGTVAEICSKAEALLDIVATTG